MTPCRTSKDRDLTPHRLVYETDRGAVLLVHAQPKASLTELAGQHGDSLKIRLAAPPVQGAANDELRRFLAERFRLPLADVQVLSGHGSRLKRVLLKGLSVERVCDVLALPLPVKQA